MRDTWPFLLPFGLGAAVAFYLAKEFGDTKAGWLGVLLVIGGLVSALSLRAETLDRELGPQLAGQVGGESLAPRWAQEVLGPWWTGPALIPRWIVAREERWGSLYLLRLTIRNSGRETDLVLSMQGRELPRLTAHRKGRPNREDASAMEQWNVTADPGTDELLVQWIVEAVETLGVAAFQIDGKKLWCRVRDPGVAFLGDNSSDRRQWLATLVERAAELGRELERLRG